MVVLTNFLAPTEGIKHQQPSTTLFVNSRDVGVGTLYITESQLSWKNNTSGEGISLPYPRISVHAVSRDLERFGHECLFLIITDNELNGEFGSEDEDGSDEESGESTEMRFVPADKGALDAMYVAMCHCQALNPDPEDFVLSGAEDEDEEDEFLDAHEGGGNLNVGADSGYDEDNLVPDRSDRSNGFHRQADDDGHDSAMEIDPGQFEDAED